MNRCFWCKPVLHQCGGGDHVGEDFFLRCKQCGTRTTHHIEGYFPTPEIKKMLRREWREGRIEAP